ncbi:MAG TPA: aminoglycoside adenylyltransferase family protein [Chloroflexota bacterium]|nr:aminoglycoside adenylyltransferase family protein [Chloroflexota bacterium]
MLHDDMKNDEPINGVRRPTTDPQIAEVLALVGEVLGPGVVGAYLHGSSVLGGLRPRSDVDILVVARRPTTRDEKRRLVDRLLTVSSVERFLTVSRTIPPELRRPIELTIVVQSQIRPWRYPPSFDFQYGDWLRREFESGNVAPWPTATNPDLASLITMVLLGGMPLLGPPPAEVLDPVPRSDYLRAIVGDIDKLLDDLDGDTCNVLLTLARIWSTVATDFIRSKDAAAAWALAQLPQEHQLVLARARAIYLGEEDERWEDLTPRIRPCVDSIVGEIKRLAADASANDRIRSVRLLG